MLMWWVEANHTRLWHLVFDGSWNKQDPKPKFITHFNHEYCATISRLLCFKYKVSKFCNYIYLKSFDSLCLFNFKHVSVMKCFLVSFHIFSWLLWMGIHTSISNPSKISNYYNVRLVNVTYVLKDRTDILRLVNVLCVLKGRKYVLILVYIQYVLKDRNGFLRLSYVSWRVATVS